MIEGVIFDYGGTIDSRGVHWSWVIWDGYQKAGVNVSLEQFREAYVMAERELAKVRHILPNDNFHDLLVKKMDIEFGYLVEQGLVDAAEAPEKARAVAQYCYEQARECIEEATTLTRNQYSASTTFAVCFHTATQCSWLTR